MTSVPFDPDADPWTVDGWLRLHDMEPIVPDLWLLTNARSIAASELRRVSPDGVLRRRGQTVRDACREAIVARDGADFLCEFCATGPSPALGGEIDHRIPLSRGGRHALENLAVLHSWCNQVKRTRVGLDLPARRELLLAWADRSGRGQKKWFRDLRAQA